MNNSSLISCICITKNEPSLLTRAISCFKTQSYTNKELLVVYESDNLQIHDVMNAAENRGNNIFFIELPANPKVTLGALKNKAIELCRGEYFCQWDDDDWYADDRLTIQMEAIIKNDAQVSFFGHWIFYDAIAEIAYLSFKRNWEGSIVCKKSIVTEDVKYALLPKLEDTPFVNMISGMYRITQVIKPGSYIYVYHGNNTWDFLHFQSNFFKGQQMSPEYSLLITDILKGIYTAEKALQLLDSDQYNQEIREKLITSKVYN